MRCVWQSRPGAPRIWPAAFRSGLLPRHRRRWRVARCEQPLIQRRPAVLVFAGSDPSGGAGIQADIQAIVACGAHPLTVITALTEQENARVNSVKTVSEALLRQQAQALLAKIPIAAVKIGSVGSLANAEAIAALVTELRKRQPALPVVVDTVLASGHGDALAVEDAVQTIAPLIGLATLITPNLPEAEKRGGGGRGGAARARGRM